MIKWIAVLLVAMISSPVFAQHTRAENRLGRIICTMPKGRLVRFAKPVYPPDAAQNGTGGAVTLDVEINKRGEPTMVRVKTGDPILARAAVSAVNQWRWKPLRLNGQAVDVSTLITVNFQPHKK